MDISVIILASGVVFGGGCAIIAANKNRDPLGWFAMGFLFSFIALVVIAAISPVEKPNVDRATSRRAAAKNGFVANPKDPERPWLG
ncbi:hypothetical protein [Rhizobium mesosinicum]|uniref:Uncharacterized protein n=1 Tax=Rhizobium mesosinicum TaxID=335017 RepID=A0ABS7H1H6_9HYPH|nr:hypothetical protein [Rhizobium mesosinicum]MBW9055995.1 hypothetical protein [Rhizobium mesosinicum]